MNLNKQLNINASSSKGLGIENISIATSEDALNAIEQIKNSFNTISKARGTTGAMQNRLLINLGNLKTMMANLSQADSTILDADMAEELVLLTLNQILSNAAVAMVGQTNLSGQYFLRFLQ